MQGKDDHILKLPVTLMRGGTSKGVYLLEEDLPEDHNEWDKILLRLMGSPDQKQIDGLGGSQSVTSKVAIIKKSDRSDADVDYTLYICPGVCGQTCSKLQRKLRKYFFRSRTICY